MNFREVISGGADGELAIHKVIQNDKLETITHKRVHKGIVNAISIIDSSHYASVGEDGTTYVTTRLGEVLTSRLVYRSTLPLKSLACNDSEIVITGDEFKVIIIAITDGSTKWTSEIMDSPIVGLGWIDNGNDQLVIIIIILIIIEFYRLVQVLKEELLFGIVTKVTIKQ